MPFTDSISLVDVIIEEKQSITATPSDVAIGKQFIGSTQHIESGALPVNPIKTDIIMASGESVNIPNGINPVSYNVKARELEEETPGDAIANQILQDKVAWVNGEKVIGTMDPIPNISTELACGESIHIDQGYHDGTSNIRAKSLFAQTFANVIPDHVLVNNDCWANGEHIDGTMPNNGAINKVLGAGAVFAIPKGYHNGNGKITVNEMGTLTPGTAQEMHIVEGKTAWVDGVQLTGTMPSNQAEEIILPMNGTYTIPNGYHTGSGTITQNIPSKEGQTIGPTKDSQVIDLAGYYMEGNITITGVDALNYQRPNTAVKDIYGEDIADYELSVEDNEAIIKIYVDNWHDNSTLNVYEAVMNLVDSDANDVNIKCSLFIDWEDTSNAMYIFGDIVVSIGLEDGTNSHMIKISNINSGIVTITEKFSAREFGVSE